MDQNNLLIESNYKNNIDNDYEEIVLHYFNIIKEYLFHAGENIIIKKEDRNLATLSYLYEWTGINLFFFLLEC